MITLTQLRLALLVLLAAFTLAAPGARADDDDALNGAKENQALAEAGSTGDSVIDLAFSVRETAGDVVDESNSAIAYANCEGCRAVAIAFQIVIVQGSPGTVTPTNVAIAVNEECPGCSTLAAAYQFVVGRGEPVEFTERGLERLEEIREALEELEEEYGELTNEQIRAQTDALADEVRDILDNDLVPVRREDDDEDDDDEKLEEEQRDAEGEEGFAPTTPTETTPRPAPQETAPAEPPATTPAETQPAPPPAETTPAEPPATTTPAP